MTRPIDPALIERNEGWDEGYAAGLTDGRQVGVVDASLRLSEAGLHAVGCPEPRRACTCGIDTAIQRPPTGMPPTPLNGLRKWQARFTSASRPSSETSQD